MLEGYLGVSVTCKLHLFCGTQFTLAYDDSVCHGCCSIWTPLLTLYATFLFGFHAYPPFYSPVWLLHGNIWGMIFLGCFNNHTRAWFHWHHSATAAQNHYNPRVGHGHHKYRLMQLPINNHLHSGKSGDLLSSYIMSTLQFLYPCPMVSFLPKLSFADSLYYYIVIVGRCYVELWSRLT